MRFARADLPGLAIAALAGPLLMVLFLAAFETWRHSGTPLLGFMGANLGIAVGVAAVFARFIRRCEWPLAFAAVIAVAVGAVYWAQQSGHDGTALATLLKWLGVAGFVGLNGSVFWQLLRNGIVPILERRERRAAELAELAELAEEQ